MHDLLRNYWFSLHFGEYLYFMKCVCHSVRRVRELNENNTKKFIEERKRQAILQSRQLESLRKIHTEQSDKLSQDIERVGVLSFNSS